MKLALFAVILLGTGIGLALGKPGAPAAAPVSAPAPAVVAPAEKRVDTVLSREASGHFLAVADVNDEPIRFVVDTGADTVALSIEDAKRAHVAFDPAQFDVVGHGAGGPVRGQAVQIADIVLDGKRATDVRGVVLEGATMSLLGQTYLRRIDSVLIEGDRMVLR
jgi:aspartyl protease family protein